jgi:signal transduction histidine kinase
MLKKFFFVTVLFFCNHHLHAQYQKTDSILIQINKIVNDSIKKERLLAYGEKLIINKSPNAQKFQQNLESFYTQKSDYEYLGRLYSRFGFANISIVDLGKALPFYLKAIEIYPNKVNNPIIEVKIYQDLMWINLRLKKFETAEKYLSKALSTANQHQIKYKQAEVYNFFGILYDSQSQFTKAIANYKKALALIGGESNIYNQISTFTNLGIALRRSKNYEESLKNLLVADTLSKKVNHVYYLQASAQNLAELTYEMKNYDLAERYILEALKHKKSEELVLKRGLFENLREIYVQKEDYKLALSYGDSLIKINARVFNVNKIKDLRDLEARYEMSLKNKINSEQRFLNLKQATEIENYKGIVEYKNQQQRIANLNFKLEKEKALTNKILQEKLLLKNNLLSEKDKTIAADMLAQEQFKFSSIKKLNNFLLAFLIAFITMFFSLLYLLSKNKKLNTIITRQKNELFKINTDKDKIFSIIGHDLRAPFNTLKSFTYLLEEDHINQENLKIYSKQLRGVISKTSILLDNVLNWSHSQINGYSPKLMDHSIKEIVDLEIDNLIEEAANKNIEVINHINEDYIIYTDYNMLTIIIRNLLSNALKFTREDGKIIFDAYLDNNKIILSVEDNGIGISDKIKIQFNDNQNQLSFDSSKGTLNETGTGLGLFLVKNFASLLKMKIWVNRIEPDEGTVFKLELENR